MSKNYFKKTLAGIFAVAIVASSIPLAPYTKVLDSISITASAISSEVDSWSGLQTAINEAEAGVETPIALAQDITASDGDTFIAIPADKVITLDLNGYTLDRGLSTATEYGYVIRNNGTLTICDESEEQTGKITGGKCSKNGGGINNNRGTLTINGGSITGNTSSYGGGIYNIEGTITINGGSITGNTSSNPTPTSAAGGGIYNDEGTLTICGGSITGNTSTYGGGIYNNGSISSLTISGGSITGNTTSYSAGGGIYNKEGTLTISGGSITGNTSSSSGGGIYNREGTLTISGGSITGNTISSAAAAGGGINNYRGTLTIYGGNISDNTARSNGGGIYNFEGTLTISGGNITGNSSATYGGGIFANAAGNITVGGSAIINGNLSTHSSDGIGESNIHLQAADGAQAKLQISETTPLTNSASIGITVWLDSGWGENTDVSKYIDGLTADNAKHIFATNCGSANKETIYYITEEDGKFVTTTEKPAAGNTIPNSTLTWEIDENGVLTISGLDEAFPECWVNDAAVEWCDKKDEVTEVVFDTPNLTKLGSAAFYEFPLAKITLPDTLTEIGYAAFKHCAQLESLDIPKGVKEIPGSLLEMEQDENNGWASITSLTSISMASDVTKIDGWAFANCTHVTSFDGLADSLKGLTSLGEGALMGISISDILIYIPETLDQTSIGRFTFNGANLGTDLEIPSFITELGENAFGWTNLEHVIIPASVSKIDINAFVGSGNLKTITLLGAADSVTIDDKAFSGNNDTMTFYVPVSQVDAYKSMKALEGSNVIGQATATFDLGGKGDNFTLDTDDEVKITEPTAPTADGVAFVGWYTDTTYSTEFNFNDALTDDEVTIYAKWKKTEGVIEGSSLKWTLDDNGVLTITGDDEAFPECVVNNALVEWCDKKDEVKEIVFATPKLKNLSSAALYDFENLTSVKLPETLTSIGYVAFGNCSALTQIVIPDTVTSIGDDAFDGCSALTEIKIPDSVTSIGDSAFFECTALKEVKIPDHVTSISDMAFYGCGSLTEIKIPNSVTSIGRGAFGECSALTEIKIPGSVTSIGDSAFCLCSALTEITIPDSVTSIGDEAFWNCSALTEVTFECDDADAIEKFNSQGNSDIFDQSALETIYVPAGCADSYKYSDGYKAALGDYINLIQEMPTAEVKGYSVSYNGDITINFHYLLSDSYKNGHVEFSDGTKVIASVSALDAVEDAKGYFVFPISMPAKNMYDEITAQFYDENGVAIGNADTFDLVTYMDTVKTYDPNYSDFVDSFLEYGKQAAAYFGVTGAPAGKTYSDSDFKDISNALEANYASTDNMGDTFVGATLLLKSTPKLRLYYSETFTGAEQNELNPNLFYTEKEISPVKFGTEDLNGYYVYNYIYKAMNSDDSGLKALCASLYNMSKAIPAEG